MVESAREWLARISHELLDGFTEHDFDALSEKLAEREKAQAETLLIAKAALQDWTIYVNEEDGAWKCMICSASGDEEELVAHKSDCAIARIAALTGQDKAEGERHG